MNDPYQTRQFFNPMKASELRAIIKEEIQNGRILQANNLLGHKFSVSGNVVQGMKMGRKLGFPTANVKYDS